MPTWKTATVLMALMCLLVSIPASAENEKLIVGTRVAPPFVIKAEDGSYTGISIELWRQAAEELGLVYEFREMELGDLLTGLQDGTLDASVAALTVTASREAMIDFSHPFHTLLDQYLGDPGA